MLYWVIIGTAVIVTADVVRNELRYGDDRVAWRAGLAVGIPESVERDVPMLVQFTTAHCGACEAMSGLVYSKATVADTIEAYFVPVKLDMTFPKRDAVRLARSCDIRGYPTLILVTPGGEPMTRLDGFHDDEEVLAWLERHMPLK